MIFPILPHAITHQLRKRKTGGLANQGRNRFDGWNGAGLIPRAGWLSAAEEVGPFPADRRHLRAYEMKPPLTAETVQSCTRELRRNLQSIAGEIYKPLPGLTLAPVAGMLGTKFRDIRNTHQPVLVTGRSFRRVLPAPHLTHKPNIFLQERTIWLFSTLDNLLPSSGRLSGHWRCFRDSLDALLESVAIVVAKRQRRSGSIFWQVRWAEPLRQMLDDLVRDAERLVESGEAMHGLKIARVEPDGSIEAGPLEDKTGKRKKKRHHEREERKPRVSYALAISFIANDREGKITSVEQLAKMCNVTKGTVYNWAKNPVVLEVFKLHNLMLGNSNAEKHARAISESKTRKHRERSGKAS